MMDFTGYINSCDIRNHHRKIRYQYNALEAAWLVYWCRHITLEEKHEAWKWIIDNMPDQVLDFGRLKNAFQGQPLHRTIADFMEMQDWFIESFTAVSPDTVYTYTHYSETLGGGFEDFDFYGVFSSWQKCIDYILNTESHLALLLAAYHRILTEEMYKKTMPLMFTKEGLQATGLMEESDNDN